MISGKQSLREPLAKGHLASRRTQAEGLLAAVASAEGRHQEASAIYEAWAEEKRRTGETRNLVIVLTNVAQSRMDGGGYDVTRWLDEAEALAVAHQLDPERAHHVRQRTLLASPGWRGVHGEPQGPRGRGAVEGRTMTSHRRRRTFRI
ncbi:MAG: hypothetical protein AAGA48_23930 [Myxococcota bacterium]